MADQKFEVEPPPPPAQSESEIRRASEQPRSFHPGLLGDEGMEADAEEDADGAAYLDDAGDDEYADELFGDTRHARGSGASADDVAEECDPHQEALLDNGVEETFPASDPVSVNHIT